MEQKAPRLSGNGAAPDLPPPPHGSSRDWTPQEILDLENTPSWQPTRKLSPSTMLAFVEDNLVENVSSYRFFTMIWSLNNFVLLAFR
jgi:hypothetical protein